MTPMNHAVLDAPICPSCGVKFIKHLGLVGTCRELQAAKARAAELEAEFRRCLGEDATLGRDRMQARIRELEAENAALKKDQEAREALKAMRRPEQAKGSCRCGKCPPPMTYDPEDEQTERATAGPGRTRAGEGTDDTDW
jgi:Skp family chaperone for outer membrane proteins